MVYGIYQDKIINEKNKTQPFGDYGNNKVKAELLIKNAIKKNNFNCTIFRPRLILGPSRLGILKNLFNLIRLNLPVPLIGDGNNFFQFISVQECAKASIMAAEKNCPSETYNLGSKKPYKIKHILKNLIRRKVKIYFDTFARNFIINVLNFLNFFKISPLDIEQYKIANQNVILDTSKVCKDLGWESVLDDSDILLQTYDYYIKKVMKKIAIFDLDGTLTCCDNFKSFMLKILIKSPKKWIFIPYLLYSFLRFFFFRDFTRRSKLKAIYTRIILKTKKRIC